MERKLMRDRTEADVGKDYCCYCGIHIVDARIRTTEHIVPLSKGGSNLYSNKRDCCKSCNTSRGNMDYDEWILKLRRKQEQLLKIPGNSQSIKNIDIKIENIKYWQFYVETSNGRLLRKSLTPPYTHKTNKLKIMEKSANEFINAIIQKEKDREPQKDGFFPLDIFEKFNPIPIDRCNDHEHEPPKFLHIPQGMGYRHKCPRCGKTTTVIPPQYTL